MQILSTLSITSYSPLLCTILKTMRGHLNVTSSHFYFRDRAIYVMFAGIVVAFSLQLLTVMDMCISGTAIHLIVQ